MLLSEMGPSTLNPKLLNPKPKTLSPQLKTQTLDPKPYNFAALFGARWASELLLGSIAACGRAAPPGRLYIPGWGGLAWGLGCRDV